MDNNLLGKYLFLKLVFCSSLLHVIRCQGWVIDDEGCRTPGGGVGDCVPIKMCKPMMDVLESLEKPLPIAIKRQLNAYTCSFEDNTVHICCPDGPIIIKGVTEQPGSKAPTDITKHRYFNKLPKECGYLSYGDKIKNGLNATLNEFPWMALLNYKSRKYPDFKCGGTIINNQWILTAAHCISNLREPLIGVRVGEHNIKTERDCELQENESTKCAPPVQDATIQKIIPHPLFTLDVIDNDIGLIKVSKINLQLENARPVCLPIDSSTDISNFEDGVVTGWGVTETGQTSDILQKVFLPIMDLNRCQNTYKTQPKVKITNKQMCAGGKDDKDSCPGDSGGPLQVATYLNEETRYVQLGVVSFGPRFCGLEGYPGVYTKVDKYMDWILNTIGQN